MKLSLPDARRIAVAGQLLPAPRGTSIVDVVRHIGYLQLDPTRAVERNHLLVLWSRLGSYSVEELQRLLGERELYEYSAAIVPTEDYPLHRSAMRRYPAYEAGTAWNDRIKRWLKDNAVAQRRILAQLRRDGPLASRDLGDIEMRPWESTGWTNERNLTRMLEFLSLQGKVLVSKREGGQRLWDVAEHVVPERRRKEASPPVREIVRRAADRSLRGLGVATPQEVRLEPFVNGPYPGIREAAEQIGRTVEVEGLGTKADSPGCRAAALATDDASLPLRPADPKPRADAGALRLPLPARDLRPEGQARVRLLRASDPPRRSADRPSRPDDGSQGRRAPGKRRLTRRKAAPESAGPAIARAIARLGKWLGAGEVAYSRHVPSIWGDSLRN